jgi:exopolysaccharide biosynthesis polyprenyl glycosylphosphotransferase
MTTNPLRAEAPTLISGKRIEPERDFLARIAQECRRAERSGQRFVLVLLEGTERIQEWLPLIITPLAPATRETDAWGWYEEGYTLGILFSELGKTDPAEARRTIVEKIRVALHGSGVAEKLAVSAFALPHNLNEASDSGGIPLRVEPLLQPMPRPAHNGIKRAIDIAGSFLLLILLSPTLLIVALAIKLTSRGPVLFRQARVGSGGRCFTMLKFRSMQVVNDHSLHENYVKQFIHGTASKKVNNNGEEVFKLVNDPRITPIGDFLRRTSLDELPQFWNVLVGDMSLVGPRPPIPYEVECYALWHQRRVLEVKPGITGLWQVRGRSKTCFDDMVRLDLEYARNWTLWLDLKILLQTPLAVLNGVGAH